MQTRNLKRRIRRLRIRKKLAGSAKHPRLCLFKSNRHIYVQVINDADGKTLVSASDLKIKKGSTKEKAKTLGKEIAKKCVAKKITSVVFDRSGYKYTGLVETLANECRAAGLKF